MTLVAQPVSVIYTGTGTTGPWAVPFRFEANAHVKVARKAASGTTTVLAEGVDYTLTGGPTAGSVVLTAALAAAAGPSPAEKLAVYRERPLSQETGLSVNSSYRSTVHEAAFDEARQVDQDLDSRLLRTLQLPPTESMSMVLPAKESRANALLGFNSAGEPIPIDPDTLQSLVDDEPLGVTPISGGGTGATTAAEARTNLGVGEIGTLIALDASHITTPHAGISHAAIISADLIANNAARLRDLGIWIVESATLTVAPAVTNGHAYLIPSDATGAWAAQVGKIAYGEAGAWVYKTAVKGWNAIAKDTDSEWYSDGAIWTITAGGGASGDGELMAASDARVVGMATTHEQGGGSRFRVHWTADGRIVVYGDQSAFGFDPAGDNWGPYELNIPWDTAAVSIEAIYAGINYILVQTNQATGNLWHMGSSAYGQGGMGGTTAATVLTRITQFVTDAVRISAVYTEANLGNGEAFWFAKTTGGNLYSCGYSGATHAMGYANTANLTTPRKMTDGSGVTVLGSITSVSCSTAYGPVWALRSNGTAVRWGAGTDGAHGDNTTTAMQWPAGLDTAPGSGINRTDIAQIVTTATAGTGTRAITWLRTTAGKIEASGSRTYGNGDGAALGSASINTFQPAAGAIDSLTVSHIACGGGEYAVAVALTSTGTGYMAGYMATHAHLGTGSTTNLNVFTALGTLPAGFSGALTDARIFGGTTGGQTAVYLEATIASAKYIATIGFDTSYATAKGTTGVAAASQTWGSVLGVRGQIAAWNVVGDSTVYGLEILNEDGELRYAGGNDQGQGGVQFGNLHSVPILQPCRLSGPRMIKPLTWRGAYSAGTEYTPRDVVEDNGSTWINVLVSTGVAPPTLPTEANANWQLLSAKGDMGVTGATGATGPNTGMDYAWNTATSGDPGAGKVLGNNATPASITQINISKTGRNGEALGTVIGLWDDSTNTAHIGHLRILSIADRTKYLEIEITGALTDNTTYWSAPCTAVGVAIPDAAITVVMFERTGNKGDTGATGATGPAGADGANYAYAEANALSNADSSNTFIGIDTGAGHFYPPKAAGVWPAPFDLGQVVEMPAGAAGIWIGSDYDSTLKAIRNRAVAGSLQPVLTRMARGAFTSSAYVSSGSDGWLSSGLTITEKYAAGRDGVVAATRIVSTGAGTGSARYRNTMSLPAGTYTMVIDAKSNTGSNQDFTMSKDGMATSTTKTATTSWQQFTLEFTLGGTTTFDGRFCQPVGAALLDMVIDKAFLWEGNAASVPADLVQRGDMLLGLHAKDTGVTVTSGAFDLTGGKVGTAELPAFITGTEMTMFAVVKRTGAYNHVAGYRQGFLYNGSESAIGSSWSLGEYETEGYLRSYFGGQTAGNNVGFHRNFVGDNYYVFSARASATGLDVWIDDICINALAWSSLTSTTARQFQVNNASTSLGSKHLWAGAAVYARALTDDERRQAVRALRREASAAGLTVDRPKNYLVAGLDSITFGPANNGYVQQFLANAAQKVFVRNEAVAGSTLCRNATATLNLSRRWPFIIDSIPRDAKDRYGRRFIVTLLPGANDLQPYYNDADHFLAELGGFCDQLKARGAIVGLCTVLPKGTAASGYATHNTLRAAVNPRIRLWQGWRADFIIDFAANTTIGDDADANNVTYYNADGLHLTATGHTEAELVYRAAVNPWLLAP